MFAVCRVAKLKSHSLGMASAHNLRTMLVPNADPEKTKFNTRWTRFGSDENLVSLVKSRLNEIGIDKPRKDAVLAVEVFMSASPEYFRPSDSSQYGEYEQGKLDEWKKCTEKFLRDRYGENLVEMILHVDEGTPHIHAMVVPAVTKTKSKRRTNDEIQKNIPAKTYTSATLDAKSMFNKFTLVNLQTDYAMAVKELGLERGIHGSKAVHQTIKAFYSVVNSQRKKTLSYSEILDPDVFDNVKLPTLGYGKDEFFRNLYKIIVKKVEKKVEKILNEYASRTAFLENKLKNIELASKTLINRFGGIENAVTEYENLDKRLKSVYQEKEKEQKDMAKLLLKTQRDAQSVTEALKTQLTYSEARVNNLEAANRVLEAQSKSLPKPNYPFGKRSTPENDLNP